MAWLYLIFLLLFAQPAQSQNFSDVQGPWHGSIVVTGQNLGVEFLFSYSAGELDGTLDIPQQNAYNLPVEFTYASGDSLVFQFETGTGPAVFRGRWNHETMEIAGDFVQLGSSFPFSIKKRTVSDENGGLPEQNLIIPTGAGQAGGTLLLTETPSALVILLTGSGAQDRDENVAGFRVFRELAHSLYEGGFSSFRYDDRGVGESRGDSDATLRDLAADLEEIVVYLRESHGQNFNKVILAGHSQGGLVASIAAKNTEADGIVFMGSPFLRGDEIINGQIIAISEAQGIEEEVVEKNLEFQQRIYEVIRTGGDWDEIEQDLYDRLEEQINELPEQQRRALGDMSTFIRSQIRRQLEGARTDWFKSFIEFEPDQAIASLELPMLALFGEKDVQVLAAPNRERAEELRTRDGLNLQIVTIPEANHLFQKAGTGLPGEYGMLEREFADGFVEAILEWLQTLD
jgi:uncharacterized protein